MWAVRARGHLPVEQASPRSGLVVGARFVTPLSPDSVRCCSGGGVYNRTINQVPATWFAATAGIRRLASHRRATAPSTKGPSPRDQDHESNLRARCRARSAPRSCRSAS